MKRLIALIVLLLFPVFGDSQFTIPLHTGASTTSSCTPPPMTYRWAASTLTGTANCGSSGTTACANGSGVYSWADAVAGDAATQTTSANQPVFTTNEINGYPALAFSHSSISYLSLATGIASSSTSTYTFYAVVNSTTTNNYYLLGVSTANASDSIGLAFNASNLEMELTNPGVAVLATNTTTQSASTWYTLVWTYNASTKAYAFYSCSGGSCTEQGAGTSSTGTFGKAATILGSSNSGSSYSTYAFSGYLAEFGYLNGVSISGIGAYSQCEYGI